MFEYESYMEIKRIIYQLYKAGEWDPLDPKIKNVYWNNLKYWQRRLGINEEDNVEPEREQRNNKNPDRKKYYDHPLSLDRAKDELGFLPISPFSVEAYVIQKELYQALNAAIENLESEQRQIILLYYFEDHTETQIAIELGVCQKTVNNKKQKALERLKELLKDFR